jgi:hypothetical protein
MRRLCALGIALSVVALASPAHADDGGPFRLTTPRGSLAAGDDALVVGIPDGRAWGAESALRPLPFPSAELVVRIVVSDEAVREAFVRVAYYASAAGRTRQLAIADSAPVAAGRPETVAVPIDPPRGAVAYRVRVLARLRDGPARSADGAVTAVIRLALRPAGSLASRLLD